MVTLAKFLGRVIAVDLARENLVAVKQFSPVTRERLCG
jgi:hypothetical protein